MSSLRLFGQVRQAAKHLNPSLVREQANRPVSVGIAGPNAEAVERIERFLCPPELSVRKRGIVSGMIQRIGSGETRRVYDIEIWHDTMAIPAHAFAFDESNPSRSVEEILKAKPDLALSLARHFLPFRKPVIDGIIASVAKENAMFSAATALPDVLPFVSLPWAIGEFASDTAFLTMNQIRMTFLIAAASDCKIGYAEQKAEIGSVAAGAFGFRGIARQLVGKIPFGGGLIPKAAISWTGTIVVGRSMERLYSMGKAFTQEEQKTLFDQLYDKGREIAASIAQGFRRPQAT